MPWEWNQEAGLDQEGASLVPMPSEWSQEAGLDQEGATVDASHGEQACVDVKPGQSMKAGASQCAVKTKEVSAVWR